MAKPMKSYVEAGAHFTEMTKQQAEAFVKSLAKSGDMRRRDAEQLLQMMVSRGRETTDRMTALVQSEVAKQLKALSERFDDVEGRLESLASSIKDGIVGAASGMTGTAGAPAPAPTPSASTTSHATAPKTAANTTTKKADVKKVSKPAKKSGAKKSGAKKSGARKSSAKKSAAKKSAAKKSGAKKSTANKSAAKKSSKQSAPDAVGSSGVRKVSTSRTAAASE
jgi:polyhydroxyalkanoate synthesis regulator phasin